MDHLCILIYTAWTHRTKESVKNLSPLPISSDKVAILASQFLKALIPLLHDNFLLTNL